MKDKSAKPRVYFDSCLFIEMAKTALNKPVDNNRHNEIWFCKKLLEASRDGEIEVFTSMITIAECLHVDTITNIDDETKRLFRGMLTSGNSGVTPVSISIFTVSDARDIVWKQNIQNPSATTCLPQSYRQEIFSTQSELSVERGSTPPNQP